LGDEQIAGFENGNPVAIVESEETAILMSALMPDYTWLATGGLSNLNAMMFTALKRHKIQFIPDLGGFFMWWKKVDELKKAGFEVCFSGFLESYAVSQDIKPDLIWRIILSSGIWSLDGR